MEEALDVLMIRSSKWVESVSSVHPLVEHYWIVSPEAAIRNRPSEIVEGDVIGDSEFGCYHPVKVQFTTKV